MARLEPRGMLLGGLLPGFPVDFVNSCVGRYWEVTRASVFIARSAHSCEEGVA